MSTILPLSSMRRLISDGHSGEESVRFTTGFPDVSAQKFDKASLDEIGHVFKVTVGKPFTRMFCFQVASAYFSRRRERARLAAGFEFGRHFHFSVVSTLKDPSASCGGNGGGLPPCPAVRRCCHHGRAGPAFCIDGRRRVFVRHFAPSWRRASIASGVMMRRPRTLTECNFPVEISRWVVARDHPPRCEASLTERPRRSCDCALDIELSQVVPVNTGLLPAVFEASRARKRKSSLSKRCTTHVII